MSLLPFFGDPFVFDFPLVAPHRGPAAGQQQALSGGLQPMDIEERENSYELYTDVPGLTADEITLEYNDQTQVLTVKAEHSATRREATGGFTRTERTRRSFQRAFTLPNDAEPENIGAEVENGVLNVHIPKKPPATAVKGMRKIAVKAHHHRSRIEGAAHTDEPVGASPAAGAAAEQPLHATQGRVEQPTT